MKRTIKPFADQGNYVAMHKICFDHIMPSISGNTWKVLCFIIRKTEGWNKERDQISYSQIKTGTGIKSDTTVRNALVELQGIALSLDETGRKIWERDYTQPDYIIAETVAGFKEPTAYRLNLEVEIHVLQKMESTPKNEDTITSVPISKKSTVRTSTTIGNIDSFADDDCINPEMFNATTPPDHDHHHSGAAAGVSSSSGCAGGVRG